MKTLGKLVGIGLLGLASCGNGEGIYEIREDFAPAGGYDVSLKGWRDGDGRIYHQTLTLGDFAQDEQYYEGSFINFSSLRSGNGRFDQVNLIDTKEGSDLEQYASFSEAKRIMEAVLASGSEE